MGVKLNPFTGKLDVVDSPSGDFSTVELNQGTQTSPSISFDGDPNTGIYSPGADQVAISTGGTGRIFVDANGNVGINAAPPTATNAAGYREFLVKGGSTNRTGILRLQDGDGTDTVLLYANEVNGLELRQELARPISFWTNGTEKLRITSTGTLMHLGAGNSTTPAVQFNGSAPVNSLVIDSTGKVGLGKSSPQNLLHLRQSSGDAVLRIENDGTNGNKTGIRFQNSTDSLNHSGGIYCIRNGGTDHDLLFQTHGTGAGNTRMVIKNNGNVGIGSTAPSKVLTIKNADPVLRFEDTGGGAVNLDANASSFVIDADPTNATGSTTIQFKTDGAERARIDSSGRLGIGTSSPGALLHVSGGNIAFGSTGTGFPYGAAQSVSVVPSEGLISFGMDGRDTPVAGQAGCYIWSGKGPSGQFPAGTLALQSRSASDRPIVFITGSTPTERVRIDAAGRVGIGTQNPAELLHVSASGDIKAKIESTSGSNAGLILKTTTSGFIMQSGPAAGNGLRFYDLGNNTERLRVDSSGRLLVGASSGHNVGGTLGNAQFSGAGTQVHFVSTSTAPSYINLAAGSSAADVTSATVLGRLQFFGYHTNGYDTGARIEAAVDGTPGDGDLPTRLTFSTTADSESSPTERMRITSDAYVRLASGTGGIQFNGDTAAANALDDYEEGTWTPTLNWTGVTYTVQSGYYTKIGNTVHVHATITWTANDVASATVISGLPFATSSVTDIGAVKINDVAVPATLSYNSLEAAFSSLYVRYINTSGVSINYPVAANDAGTINVNCVYKVA